MKNSQEPNVDHLEQLISTFIDASSSGNWEDLAKRSTEISRLASRIHMWMTRINAIASAGPRVNSLCDRFALCAQELLAEKQPPEDEYVREIRDVAYKMLVRSDSVAKMRARQAERSKKKEDPADE